MRAQQRLAVALLLAVLAATAASAQTTLPHIPLRSGLTVVSVLSFPQGDRENVVTAQTSTAGDVTYTWHATANTAGERTEVIFSRFVRAADLASATRLNTVFWVNDNADYPGYTAFSLSRAVYESLRTAGTATFVVTARDDSGLAGAMPTFGAMQGNLKFKGTLSRVAPLPEPFALIANGRRVSVPALHVHGRFAFQDKPLEQDFWVLADAAHPLILKTVTGKDVLQVVRVEMPGDDTIPAVVAIVERSLDEQCRAELPGIYFAFGTADLDPASSRTLADIAAMLARHPQWTLAIEGHTDSVGTPAANQRLSQARAQTVLTSLRAEHGIDPNRLGANGFGATRPRESNDTLEGRARNRRVELVRPCATNHTGEHS